MGVGEHQHRVLAAQLDRHLLLLGDALARHRAARRRRAGEQQLVHGRPRQLQADVGAAVYDPHQALGQARAREHPCDSLGRYRGARRRLEDDAVAGQQRTGDLAERLCEGGAAGADHAYHAVGLIGDTGSLGQRQRAVHADAAPTEHARSVVRDPLERVDRDQQLERRHLCARARLLGGDGLAQLVELVHDRLGHAAHVARPVLQAQERPQRLNLGDLGDHLGNIWFCGVQAHLDTSSFIRGCRGGLSNHVLRDTHYETRRFARRGRTHDGGDRQVHRTIQACVSESGC